MSSEGIGVTLESVINYLEEFAPKALAEKWDNTGLLIEPHKKGNVKNILLTNDLTEDVVDEALQVKADLIISYHPPVFQPLKSITNSTWKVCGFFLNQRTRICNMFLMKTLILGKNYYSML